MRDMLTLPYSLLLCVVVCYPAGLGGLGLAVLSFPLSIKVMFNFRKGLKDKCKWSLMKLTTARRCGLHVW